MALKQELIIEIAADGSVTITTHGIKGSACEEELHPLAKALGKIQKQERTKEFYEKSFSLKNKNTTTK